MTQVPAGENERTNRHMSSYSTFDVHHQDRGTTTFSAPVNLLHLRPHYPRLTGDASGTNFVENIGSCGPRQQPFSIVALSHSCCTRDLPAITTWNWPLNSPVLVKSAVVKGPAHSRQTMWH